MAKQKSSQKLKASTKRTAKSNPSKGLGDTVEKVFKATGVDKVAKFILGEDCGCDERKLVLNRMFPYEKPECLMEDEYEWLKVLYTERRNQIDNVTQERFLKIYNRVFRTNERGSGCSACFRTKYNKLEKIYNKYDNESNTK